jgi:hypothetical protein
LGSTEWYLVRLLYSPSLPRTCASCQPAFPSDQRPAFRPLCHPASPSAPASLPTISVPHRLRRSLRHPSRLAVRSSLHTTTIRYDAKPRRLSIHGGQKRRAPIRSGAPTGMSTLEPTGSTTHPHAHHSAATAPTSTRHSTQQHQLPRPGQRSARWAGERDDDDGVSAPAYTPPPAGCHAHRNKAAMTIYGVKATGTSTL